MTRHQNHSPTSPAKRSEKSGYLSLHEISELVAHGAVNQHQLLAQANNSQVYATDLDEFMDLCAWQSVNANPSTEQGVRP